MATHIIRECSGGRSRKVIKTSTASKTAPPRASPKYNQQLGFVTPRVSNKCRYRNSYGVILRPQPGASGYVRIGARGKHYSFHRVVARSCHLPGRLDQTTVDHIDNDKTNNHPENLQRLTPAEQVQKSYATNPGRKSSALKQSKPVKGRPWGKGVQEWTEYTNSYEAAALLRLRPVRIRDCCRGKLNKTGTKGAEYEFKWVEKIEQDQLDGEEWRVIPDSRGAHVSSFGRYRSAHGITFTPSPSEAGYAYVSIMGKLQLLHRVVAMVFLSKRGPGKYTVDHIDNDRLNNRADNLQWLTPAEQIEKSYATNPERKSNAPRLSKPVMGRPLEEGAQEWTTYASSHEAARELCVDAGNVRSCCRGSQSKVSNSDKTRTFEFKRGESNEPELLEGEEWYDAIFSDEENLSTG